MPESIQSRNLTSTSAHLVRGIALVLVAGCGATAEDDTNLATFAVDPAEPKLYRETDDNTYWPTDTVPYCYAQAKQAPDLDSTAWNDTVTLTEEAIRKWDAVRGSALEFTGGGVCGESEPSDTLRILVSSVSGGQKRPEEDHLVVEFGLSNSVQSSKAIILHELGHALGFSHEYRRNDRTENLDKSISSNCSAFTNFVYVDVVTGAPACGPRGHTAEPGADDEVLTAYDPVSVLNSTYCHCRAELSALDRVGVCLSRRCAESSSSV